MILTTIISLSYGLLGDLSPRSTYFIHIYAMSEGRLAPLHRSGLAARWQAGGMRWVAFFQDTNGLVFRGLPAALGMHWMALGCRQLGPLGSTSHTEKRQHCWNSQLHGMARVAGGVWHPACDRRGKMVRTPVLLALLCAKPCMRAWKGSFAHPRPL